MHDRRARDRRRRASGTGGAGCALRDEGAEVHVVSDKKDRIQGFSHHDKGDEIKVDMPLDEADADQCDGLVLPGGVINPDALRLEPRAIHFVRHFVKEGLPIAAICHGPLDLDRRRRRVGQEDDILAFA